MMKYLLTCFLLISCSFTDISIEKKMLIDNFSQYKSFSWSDHNNHIETENSAYDTKDIRRRIRSNIQCELEEKGLQFQDISADLIIEFHILIDKKSMTVSEIHEDHTTAFGYRNIEQKKINYEEGTIMVEMIDTKTNRIIWYGLAKSILTPNPNFNDQKQQLTKIMGELFKDLK